VSAKKDRDSSPRLQNQPKTHYHVLMGGPGSLVFVRHAHAWCPPTDVVEEKDRLVVLVEIAGMRAGEFHLSIDAQRLVIAGSRATRDRDCVAYHQLEVRYGDFRTEVLLPWRVDEENVTAHYEDGFLRVELPRLAAEDSRVITVKKKQVD
jgi:HSP20 family protein